MYEAFYGLREKPFSILPDPDLIYWGQTHRMAFAMLEFGVLNNAGFTVITGEIGSGKTTLVRHLLRKLDTRFINVGLISNTPRDRTELMQWIMMALGQPYEGSTAKLFRDFEDFLYSQYSHRRRTILIIDEAQNLGEEALEGLRMLSNINVDKDQYLQLILIGQPQLKDVLRRPQLLQFAQRVSSDFHLKALPRKDVSKYIEFRVSAVGGRSKLFSEEAVNLVAEATRGVPRMINILCDTALVYGFSVGMSVINARLMQEVIEDKKNFGIFALNGTAEK